MFDPKFNVGIFLTEMTVNGRVYAGPDILAGSWEEAREIAGKENVEVVGILVGRMKCDG